MAATCRQPGPPAVCAAGPSGHGALPRGWPLLREGRGVGPGVGGLPPGARSRPGRAGGHCGPGTHVLAASAPHPGRCLSEGEQVGAQSTHHPPFSGFMSFPGGSDGKESACSAGDPGLIPGSGRSTGEGNGNPLQYSPLQNPMDRGA